MRLIDCDHRDFWPLFASNERIKTGANDRRIVWLPGYGRSDYVSCPERARSLSNELGSMRDE
jgi:hypothetical protein